MALTQTEILNVLGFAGMSPARVASEFGKMNMDDFQCERLFRDFAGDAAEVPPIRILSVVVGYLVYDAAAGKPLDVAGAVARTERLAAIMPGSFTAGAKAEARMQREKERAERRAAMGIKDGEPAAPKLAQRVTENADGTVTIKRGRFAEGPSLYDRIKAFYDAAADKAREVLVPAIVSEFKCGDGTATTYWYKAKKEAAGA